MIEDALYDKEIERYVLGLCLKEPETVVNQAISVGVELFYDPRYALIFNTLKELLEKKADTSLIAVIHELEIANNLEKVGGELSILNIERELGSPVNAMYYIELLKAYSLRRMIYSLCCSAINACADLSVNIDITYDRIFAQLSDIKILMSDGDAILSHKIRDWIRDTEGEFFGTDVDKELSIGTQRDKENRKKVLQRLSKEGIIVRASEKRSHYRKIDSSCEDIDWKSAVAEEYKINFPLGLTEYVKIYPGNIIIIAGESNSGKTAFLLNLVKLNMAEKDIYYFSSEMGGEELQIRIDEFNDIKREDWKFHPKERASNFSDVIVPGALNIIDFLEVYDEFYKIGAYIKHIFDKIGRGIAVIAIQKNPGAMHGTGGAKSIEKARLYLTMEPGKCIIRKAKNFRYHHTNPNGFEVQYNIINGCKFVNKTGWYKPDN